LKGLAWGQWEATAQARSDKPKAWYQPITDPDLGRLSLSYTLDLPITAAVPPGDWESFELALSIARGYQPLNDEELARLRERVQFAAPIFESGG
ncbi:MAG: aldo/keto reductase, partial [Acidobacteriota bacterium]|nr:aldo/keto reductase [Acidobacteriota bacterium]